MVDRNIIPEIEKVTHIDYLKAQSYEFENGMPVHFINAGSQDVIKLDFVFNAGAWFQTQNLQAAFTGYMLKEGSSEYSSHQIAEKFDYYGSYIQISVDHNFAQISVISLNKHLSQILPVLEDLIKRPLFPEHELQVLIEKHKQKYKLENEKVKTICQKKFSNVLFGEEHPYSFQNKIEDFDKLNRDILIDFYKLHYNSTNCRLILSGKVEKEQLKLISNYFGKKDWQGNIPTIKKFSVNGSNIKYHFIKKDKALQSAVRVGKLWVDKTHPDYLPLTVLVTILGGYFSSRLMMNIREDKGYTYGIGSYVMSLKHETYFVISTEVGNEFVEGTKSEINNELLRLQNELIPIDELESVKNYLIGEFLRDFDGPFALAARFKSISDFDLGYDYYDKYLKAINEVTAEQLQVLAGRYLNINDMYTIVVGA